MHFNPGSFETTLCAWDVRGSASPVINHEDTGMSKLNGKVAVITGGSSGIGLATAKRFVAEGAYVYITGRRQSELDKAAREIGRSVSAVSGDVADLADLDALYKKIAADGRRIDVIFASAGFVEWGFLPTATADHYDKTFNINARGAFFTVQKALPLLNDGASIILVSSCVHLKGIPQYTVYAATKAALRSFARSWAVELKDRRIRVNTLSPGATDTPIVDGQFRTKAEADAARNYFSQIITLGRLGRPEELASAAFFLASDESSYMTGADLVVDGGWTQV
jgi:NAD(P)-dependent dehydrogenase (short-subunit alcohol dehydrogenase family)